MTAELRNASDSEKLRALADYLDITDPLGNDEVQRDLRRIADETEQLRTALNGIIHERNDWARQVADIRDERDTALGQADQARAEKQDRENTILRIEALLYEWERLGRGLGIHGRQLREALDADIDDMESTA